MRRSAAARRAGTGPEAARPVRALAAASGTAPRGARGAALTQVGRMFAARPSVAVLIDRSVEFGGDDLLGIQSLRAVTRIATVVVLPQCRVASSLRNSAVPASAAAYSQCGRRLAGIGTVHQPEGRARKAPARRRRRDRDPPGVAHSGRRRG